MKPKKFGKIEIKQEKLVEPEKMTSPRTVVDMQLLRDQIQKAERTQKKNRAKSFQKVRENIDKVDNYPNTLGEDIMLKLVQDLQNWD